MNKQGLAVEVAEVTGLTKKDSVAVVDAVLLAITESLKAGEDVKLQGFGNFVVRDRAERKGRNPQTQEEMIIPASKAPAFKAAKNLKEIVK